MAIAKRTSSWPINSKKVDTCRRATSLIMSYLTGELDPETTRAFEEHLGICPDCVAFLNTYKKTIQLTRSLHYGDMPSEIRKRVREFIREKVKGRPPVAVKPLRRFWQPL